MSVLVVCCWFTSGWKLTTDHYYKKIVIGDVCLLLTMQVLGCSKGVCIHLSHIVLTVVRCEVGLDALLFYYL